MAGHHTYPLEAGQAIEAWGLLLTLRQRRCVPALEDAVDSRTPRPSLSLVVYRWGGMLHAKRCRFRIILRKGRSRKRTRSSVV